MITATQTSDAVDLLAVPPEEVVLYAPPGGGATFTVAVTFAQTDERLPQRNIEATLNWDEGLEPEVFTGMVSLEVNDSRLLTPGLYFIRLRAVSKSLPAEEPVLVVYPVRVLALASTLAPVPKLYGPVLPRDAGYPGPKDWVFTLGSDLQVLESSVKMLLGTNKGERLMEPDYGTHIHRLVFDPLIQSVESLIEHEITEALGRWEPRLSLQHLSVVRSPNARRVDVTCTFLSQAHDTPLEISVPFQL